jgi:hypothetical protein
MAEWIRWIIESGRFVQPQIEVEFFTVEFLTAGDLVPIAAICGVSVLLSMLWLAAVWQYVGSKNGCRCRRAGTLSSGLKIEEIWRRVK